MSSSNRALDRVIFEPSPKQAEFIAATLSGDYRFLIYGGAIRGGKTYVMLAILFLFCRVWPGSRWAIVRKDLPTLKRNLLPVYNKLKPAGFVGATHKTDWTATCANGSQIIFFTESIKDDPDLDRWKGLEANGFFLEEVNEIQEQTFNKAIERAGSWRVPGLAADKQPPPMVLGTCNPAKNWIKPRVYDKYKAGSLAPPWFYLPAYITDNPHLSPEYVDNLKNLPPREYERFVLGNWDVADDPDQLIKGDWFDDALGRPVQPSDLPRRLGVDVARDGDDDTVFALTEGWHILSLDNFSGINTVRTSNMTQALAREHDIAAADIRIDTVGVGGGVADNLKENADLAVGEFIGGATAPSTDSHLHFKNLRTAAWWGVREAFRLGRVSISSDIPERVVQMLRADLTAPRYGVDNEKQIALESKKLIKKRLGRSPDYGDALAQAWADMPQPKGFFFA